MISATINMKGGRGNNEKVSARKRAMNYKASKKPSMACTSLCCKRLSTRSFLATASLLEQSEGI